MLKALLRYKHDLTRILQSWIPESTAKSDYPKASKEFSKLNVYQILGMSDNLYYRPVYSYETS